MVELNDNEKKVVEAMREIGASEEGNAKTADIISGKCPFSKSTANNILTQLQNKKVVKRVAKSKAAVYFLTMQP
jgi:predicted transcriptional regulator